MRKQFSITCWRYNFQVVNVLNVRKTIVFVLALAVILSCGSHNKHKKKLKPGKPIPCPTKDC
jgi:hypothetical protein